MVVVPVSAQGLNEAVVILKRGGVVAFPTETYYGLAVDPFNEEAVARLFEVKRRPRHKPILCLIEETERVLLFTETIDPVYGPIMARFWPGPLTLLFKARRGISSLLTCDDDTIGLRVSSHPVAQKLCRKSGQPITATSANVSGEEALTTAHEVAEQLAGRVDLILDGGKTPGGKGSTIVGTEGDTLKLIRAGVVGFSEILLCS